MDSKIKENISLEFDAFSQNYTEDMIIVVPHYEKLMACFDSCLPQDFHPQRILDLGCGNGNSTAEIIKQFPEAEYTLVDASAEMIGICEKRFSNFNIKLVESYFSDFLFQKEHYDLVVAGFSLHHCVAEEKQFLFQQIKSALSPKGRLAISDLFITKTDEEHPQLLHEWKDFINENDPSEEKWLWLKEHYDKFDSPHNYKSQETWLTEAGFSNVEIAWKTGFWMHVIAK